MREGVRKGKGLCLSLEYIVGKTGVGGSGEIMER